MANQPALRWEALDERLLKDIYDSDQAIYPAPELTYSRLRSWVDAYPELCLSLRSGPSAWGANTLSDDTTNTTVHASIIVLPLQQPFWDMLRRADISEHDVDSESMFPPLEDSGVHAREEKFEVGLHVFHIERSPSFATVWKGAKFTVLALEEIRRRVPRIFKSWDVVGYTGEDSSDPCFHPDILPTVGVVMRRESGARF